MSLPIIINQIESGNCTVGSNPTPSDAYHYNELRRGSNTAVITEHKKPHYQQVNLNKRDGISKIINVVRKLKKNDCSIPFRMPFDYKNLSIPSFT